MVIRIENNNFTECNVGIDIVGSPNANIKDNRFVRVGTGIRIRDKAVPDEILNETIKPLTELKSKTGLPPTDAEVEVAAKRSGLLEWAKDNAIPALSLLAAVGALFK